MLEHTYDLLHYDYTVEETEEYLREVIKSKYNVSADPIIAALDMAKHAHDGQLRCDDLSYIIHPMRVALMLDIYESNITSKILIAALLHDTIEKTCLAAAEIELEFGRYVAKLILSVTRLYDTKCLQEKRTAKFGNWQEVMSGSHEARAIKTFEDLDNMICWKAIPEESPCRKKIPRWLAEVGEMSLPLARATNSQAYTLMRQEYEYYVKRGYADQAITC